LNLPNESQFLYLTSSGWKTGKKHTIEIWFVGYRQRYYVMSERRYKAHWVQNILHNQKIKCSLNNIRSEGNARIISKDNALELASEVQKLMKTKYGWDKGLIIELTISS
jgi:F420H(2)-dependent quinone reductase